jgi:hypothetical protein
MVPEILCDVCLRKNCKERHPLPPPTERMIRFHLTLRALVLVLAGMLIGGALAVHLRGQSPPSRKSADVEMIAVTTKVSIMEGTLNELVKKVDRIQSEADTTEAMGAGIGLAITGLQLLGFFTKARRLE